MTRETGPTTRKAIYTIGHSNHSVDAFLSLLKECGIDVVIDTRSQPYSRYAPQFEARALKESVVAAGIRYLFLGKELGGRPANKDYYDAEGRVCYGLVAQSAPFIEGITRLERGIHDHRIALLCAEENPAQCHRRLLVGRILVDKGIEVRHIRGDGRVEIEQASGATGWYEDTQGQLTLFPDQEIREWKSIQSVLPRDGRRTSSEP